MTRHLLVPGFFAALLVAAPASSQQLSLKIQDGLVDLDANGASVRQILDEWARVGGTRIVNGERVAGAPVTLKLESVPERQALEIILRSVAGYLTAPRASNAAPGASMYDRILVLATSVAPAGAATAAAGTNAPSPRFAPPRNTDNGAEDPSENQADVDPGAVFTFPQPGQFPAANGFGQPTGQPVAPDPGNPFAPTQPQPSPFGQPGSAPFVPVQPGTTPFGTPMPPGTTPFGTPVQPGTNPYAPVPGQPPPVFTFTPQGQPVTPPPNGWVGSPVPGVAPQPQPAQPVQRRPPRD